MIKRDMTADEHDSYLMHLARQVGDYKPDVIVGIARSGLPYAAWVAQILNHKRLGYYNPKTDRLEIGDNEPYSRVVFIDDSVVTGDTYNTLLKRFSNANFEFRVGAFFTDADKTSDDIRSQVLAGVNLDYFATAIPGIKRVFTEYVRFRDESI